MNQKLLCIRNGTDARYYKVYHGMWRIEGFMWRQPSDLYEFEKATEYITLNFIVLNFNYLKIFWYSTFSKCGL